MTNRSLRASLPFAAALVLLAPGASAGGFFDDFDAGASLLWGNEIGNWAASGGVYDAGSPGNFPSAHSSLPWDLADAEFELDINNVQDGGVWLRSTIAPGSAIGRTGVLLVTGVGGGLYWHNVTNPNSYGPSLNAVGGLFTPGVSDPHLRITVVGDVYSVFVDGSPTPATTLTTNAFASGRFAVYDNSGQTFDNVSITDVPPCISDLDGDGDSDTTDLNILLSAFGCTPGGGACPGDIDGDGDTDTTDLNILLSDFGCVG